MRGAMIVIEMGAKDGMNVKNNAGETPGYHRTATCPIR
jgi:hypothetical protein